MPVHCKKKDAPPNTPGSTQEQPAPPLPDQQAFHQHLRELAKAGIRVMLEGVMREELDTLIGVAWGESSRQQQRLSQRLLQARLGHLLWPDRGVEDTPRPRGPVPHAGRGSATAAMNHKWQKDATGMFVAGVSTRHPWEKWPEP